MRWDLDTILYRSSKKLFLLFCCLIATFLLLLCHHSDISGWKEIIFPRTVAVKTLNLPLVRNEYVRLLIGKVNEAGARLIILDPLILYNFITPLEQEIFKTRGVSFLARTVTFGAFTEDFTNILKEANNLTGSRFNLTIVQGVVPPSSWNEPEEQTVTHLVFNSSSTTIHIVRLHASKEFILIGRALPFIQDLLLGKHQCIFHRFSPIPVILNGQVLHIPSDPAGFIIEIPNSRFISCNTTSAENFAKENPDLVDKENGDFTRVVIDSLKAIQEAIRPLLVPFWISSGTLLGWYRQCSVIPYTNDVDITISRNFSSLDWVHHFKYDSKKLRLHIVFGLPEIGYEVAVKYGDLKIDIFFLYEDSNSSWFAGHLTSEKAYFKYIYPKFNVCSGMLLGIKVLVPCDAEAVVESEYGPEWSIPKQSWSWSSSAFNIGPKIYWDSKIKDNVFTVYS